MKIGIPVTGDRASGPGEAMEVVIVDTSTGQELERYENPALTATSARGIMMVRSVVDRGAEALVVGGIGQHALDYARQKLKVMGAVDMTVPEIVRALNSGKLVELHHPNHEGHHSH